jgi:hypothetical protein
MQEWITLTPPPDSRHNASDSKTYLHFNENTQPKLRHKTNTPHPSCNSGQLERLRYPRHNQCLCSRHANNTRRVSNLRNLPGRQLLLARDEELLERAVRVFPVRKLARQEAVELVPKVGRRDCLMIGRTDGR